MSLKEYRAKRDFGRTSEPAGSRPKAAFDALVYVIQKHKASHLHYDLRLESEGVLKSWAVPKVPVDKEGVKRLAVQTEDHPLGYETFEGVIPEPEYGAGTVEIWDSGVYESVEAAPGKMIINIKGRKLKGRFALIRIKGREGGDRNWLFIKLKSESG
jgi:bifunctional non-homologous end joining protein LigD